MFNFKFSKPEGYGPYLVWHYLRFLDKFNSGDLAGFEQKLDRLVSKLGEKIASMRIVFIEGNIGIGKSTFIMEDLIDSKCYHSKRIIIEEPVEMWNCTVNKDNCSILEFFYNELAKQSSDFIVLFQMWALVSRMIMVFNTIYMLEVEEIEKCIFYAERSIFTDKYYH